MPPWIMKVPTILKALPPLIRQYGPTLLNVWAAGREAYKRWRERRKAVK